MGKKENVIKLNNELNQRTDQKLKEEGINIKLFELKPATEFFQAELGLIKNQQLNAFFTNVLQSAPASFFEDAQLMQLAANGTYLLRASLEGRQVPEEFLEAVAGAMLIAKILKNEPEFQGAYSKLYASATRLHIENEGLNKSLPVNLYENVMRIVEAHDANAVISPLLEARQGTAEAEVSLLFKLAGHPSVTVSPSPQKGAEEDEQTKTTDSIKK